MNNYEFVRFMEEKKQERIEVSQRYKPRDIYFEILEQCKRFTQTQNKQAFVFYGLRGIGKSVALSQALGEVDAMFIDGDVLCYYGLDLLDVIREYALYNSSKIVFIDELAEIPNWGKALKIIYDNFNLKVVATGSSAVKLKAHNKEIIRRARFKELSPLSFREYLRISQGINLNKDFTYIFSKRLDKVHEKVKADLLDFPKDIQKHFREYLNVGFPLVFETGLELAVDSIVSKILTDDFSMFSGFNIESTVRAKKILDLIAVSKPEEISLSKFSEIASCSKTTASNILDALEFSSLLTSTLPFKRAASKLRKEKKYLFTSPVIRNGLCKRLMSSANIGGQREDFAVSSLHYAGFRIEHIKNKVKHPDYVVGRGQDLVMVEIGGPSKTKEQIKEGIVFRDDDVVEYRGGVLTLPLFLLGFL